MLQITVLALLYEKQKKLFLAKHQTKFPKRYKENNKTTTVKTRNPLSNVRIKPSFFQLLRSPHFPKRKTKKHSFFNLLRKQNSPKRATQKYSCFEECSLCFCDVSEAVALNFLLFVTPSSAAVCKLAFCGKLLRSKTTKRRLTNCRAHEVCGAGAPCYVIILL